MLKILSKALAFRIKKVLPNIIHHNQSGYVEGRYIGETIRTIYDIMDFIKSEGMSGILAFLDFEKAFDSIEWNFINRCLEIFGFGSDFIRWFSVLYKDISSCVCNNGVHSDYFTLERGVSQGDPLSPYIFITAVELLSINIRTNIIKMNYKQRLKKLENTANWWKGRGLTLYGRAQIINSLLLPKLIYIATMFAVPEEVIKDINRIVFKFFWRGQVRVVRTAMINSYENGGLRVLDFETLVKSVRLSWLKRLYASKNAGWKSYLSYLFKPFGGLFLFHCDYDPKDYNISNQFYAELIEF